MSKTGRIEQMYGAEIADETASRAERVGGRHAAFISSLLTRYVVDTPIISRVQGQEIKQAEKELAAKKFTEEREKGLHNDLHSTEKGISALIRLGSVRIEDYTDFIYPPKPKLIGPTLKFIGDEVEGDSKVFIVEFPDGAFDASRENGMNIKVESDTSVHLFGLVAYVGHNPPRLAHDGLDMHLSVYEVIRIQCSNGQLWQNPNIVDMPDLAPSS